MSLVAATSLGVSGVDQIRTRVSSEQDVQEDGELRLIVQSYARDTVQQDRLPASDAKPLASIQRAITAEELRDGVDVSVLQLPDSGVATADSVVVAWIERGVADLEFDGMESRPAAGSHYGVAVRGADIVLRAARA